MKEIIIFIFRKLLCVYVYSFCCLLRYPDRSSQLFFQRCFDHTVVHEQNMVRFEVHEAELARMVRGVSDVAIEAQLTSPRFFAS